jgi:UDPglucose 6-dehydrogenase
MSEARLRVSVIGLGKLGACMAAALAERGHTVFGVDVREEVVDLIARGEAPVTEPGLQEMITRNRERITATQDIDAAVEATDLTFVVVPTPSEPNGAFSLEYAAAAFRALGQALRSKTRYHLVVLTSTVLPGSTRYRLIAELEASSGRRCGPDFGVCYSPEFIALGSVIKDFLNPDFTLIGEFDERSGTILEQAYHEILLNNAPARRMSIENAELTKIALNTYVTTKITFANMLADLCERIPGGDIDAVSDALGLDRRIGRRYLTGAVSYGGPCFPRDNLALSYLARQLGTSADLAEATHAMNQLFTQRLIERLLVLSDGKAIGIAGLAYKPDTTVVEQSAGLAVAAALANVGRTVFAFEPAGPVNGLQVPERIVHSLSLGDLVAAVDVLAITTPDPAFRVLPLERRSRPGKLIVLDCWRMCEAQLKGREGVEYHAVGRNGDPVNNALSFEALWQSPASVTAQNGLVVDAF